MLTPSDKEIADFFDNLTPADFASTPSETHLFAFDEDEIKAGSEDFNRFMLDNLSRLLDNGNTEIAVTHDGRVARMYQQRPEETSAKWLIRVSKDAKAHGVKWLFVGMPGEASVGDPDKMFDPNKPEEVERARESGHLIEAMNWYAESTEEGAEETAFGAILFEDDAPRIIQSTTTEGVNPAFSRVLHS